ncbi:MAG: autotransporter-associated beta strand repeat-containing protein, partial [Opitutales bacterium]|nr:autotransporter-associated beta strand repeat-containing protein [Opitutales bacterium]
VILSGVALPGVNLPPVVTEAAPAFLELSAGRPLVVDLGDWFADPDGDALAFAAFAADGGLLGTEVSGSELTLTGLAAGETSFTVSANDGSNPAVTHSVRVLLYGAPHELSAGDFSFTAWSPDEPAGSFPPNMLFVQSNVNDPGLAAPLLFAYSIAGDAHADDDANFPYRATSRTRLNGLGDDGISFINTGRGRDLGGAVVSLDTTGKANVRVSFTGGTVMANARVYGLRLQYRVGLESAWTDVFDGESVVEYLRATDGDAEAFEAIALPAEVSDAPLVQLRWKYFHISGTSGARSMLRLDDIVVTAGEPGAATALAFAPGLQQWVQSGVAPGLLEVRAVDEDGALDPDFAGAVTLSLLGDGVLSGTLTAAAVDGVATFDDWVVTGPDGVFELLATAPGLTPAVSDALLLSTFPVFLPGGDGDWTVGANWTSVLFPNGTGLGAFVPAPALGDRNVNLRAPVSIGSLIMDTGETAFRNRLRDRSTGNTLTFNGGGVPALLRITGTGEGFVELQNEAGTVLATDLRLAVENAVGDAEYGALRLRDGWSGPGGLIKEGPGMASLTGGDKNFAGAVWIEQGVLALTEPSVPANASGVTVLDGGQLRLVSASSESNPVRIYTFGGTLSLSGFGRSGVEEGEGMGILGALRYEPGSFGNFAEVSSAVVVAADAGIHVSGENTLALTGSLGGSGDLVKSGGGSLVLGNAPSTFTGAIEVERGELRLGGTNLSGNASTLSVVAEAALGGTGQWGGAVVLAGGSALSFDFAAGLPASAPLILGEWSAGGAIAVEVALPAGVTGPQRVTLIDAGAFATAPGAEVGNWVLSGAEAFPLSRLERAGEGLVLLLAATPFDLWTLENFGGSALADPAISGPLGEPLGDSVPNLLKYALGVGALERVDTEALSSGLDVGGHLFLRFRRDPAKADIVYVVEASADLLDWTETLYDSGIDLIPNNDGAHMVVSDSTAPSPGSPRFLRLRVKRDE